MLFCYRGSLCFTWKHKPPRRHHERLDIRPLNVCRRRWNWFESGRHAISSVGRFLPHINYKKGVTKCSRTSTTFQFHFVFLAQQGDLSQPGFKSRHQVSIPLSDPEQKTVDPVSYRLQGLNSAVEPDTQSYWNFEVDLEISGKQQQYKRTKATE